MTRSVGWLTISFLKSSDLGLKRLVSPLLAHKLLQSKVMSRKSTSFWVLNPRLRNPASSFTIIAKVCWETSTSLWDQNSRFSTSFAIKTLKLCDLKTAVLEYGVISSSLPLLSRTGHGGPAGERRLLQGGVGEPLQAGFHRHPPLPPGRQQLLRRDSVHVQRGEGSFRQASFKFIFFLLFDHSFF